MKFKYLFSLMQALLYLDGIAEVVQISEIINTQREIYSDLYSILLTWSALHSRIRKICDLEFGRDLFAVEMHGRNFLQTQNDY